MGRCLKMKTYFICSLKGIQPARVPMESKAVVDTVQVRLMGIQVEMTAVVPLRPTEVVTLHSLTYKMTSQTSEKKMDLHAIHFLYS